MIVRSSFSISLQVKRFCRMEFVILAEHRDAFKMFRPIALVFVIFLVNYQVQGVQYLKREKREDKDGILNRPNRYYASASIKANHVARFRPAESNSLVTRTHKEEAVGEIAKRFVPKSIDEAEPLTPLPIRHAVSYVKERAIRSSPDDGLSKKRTSSIRRHFRSNLTKAGTNKSNEIMEDRFKSDIRHEIEKKQQNFRPNQKNKIAGHRSEESKSKMSEFEIRDFSGQKENEPSGDSEVEDVTDSSYDNALQMQNFSQGQSLSDELDYSYDNLFSGSGSGSGSGCATGSGSGCNFGEVADEFSLVAYLPKAKHGLEEGLSARSLPRDFTNNQDSRPLATSSNRQLIHHLVQLKSFSWPTKEHRKEQFGKQEHFARKKTKTESKDEDPHSFPHENHKKATKRGYTTGAAKSTSIGEKHKFETEEQDTSTFLGSSGFANDPMMTYEALLRTDKFPDDMDTTENSASSSKERRELHAKKSSLATLVRQLAMIDPNENDESNSGDSDQSATSELREKADLHVASTANQSDSEKSLDMRKRSLDDDNYEDRGYPSTKNRWGLDASSLKGVHRHEKRQITPSFGGDSASTFKFLSGRHKEIEGESDKLASAERRSILSDADPNINYMMETEGKSEERDESEPQPTQRLRSKMQKSRVLDALKDAIVLYAGYKKSSVPRLEHPKREVRYRGKQVEGVWTGLGSKPLFINKVDSEDFWHSGENSLSSRSTEEVGDPESESLSVAASATPKENESKLHLRSVGRRFVTEHKRSSLYKEMKNNFLRRTQRSLHQQRRMVKEPEEKYLDTRGKGKVIIAFEDVKELVPRHLHPYEEEDVPSFYLDTKQRLAKSVEEDLAAMPYREPSENGAKMIQARSSLSDDEIDRQDNALDEHNRQRRVQGENEVKDGGLEDNDTKNEGEDENDIQDEVKDDGVKDSLQDDDYVKNRIQDNDHKRKVELGPQSHIKKRSSHVSRKTEKRSHDETPVVRTLSVDYVMNKNENGRETWEQGMLKAPEEKSFLHVKRAQSEDGYLGCFIDVIHPDRDLPVRAGIPFVTPNNCRSACKRTGYYYAGLQYGYLCFCGNTYGRYDMAPESECSHTCSGDSNKRCGGYWRNAIFDTAGAPDIANEGPIPFYLPPKKAEDLPSSNATEVSQNKTNPALLLPPTTSQPPILPPPPLPQQKPPAINTITPPSFFLSPKNSQNPNISMQQPLLARGGTVKFIKIADITRNGTTILQPGIRLLAKSLIPQLSNIQIIATNPISSKTLNTREVINTDIVKKSTIPEPPQASTGTGGQVMFNDPTILRREPKVFPGGSATQESLMHWAYIHPQSRSDIVPTLMPHPTQPLKVQPDTRVYKGEIRLRQNWYDDFKDPSSAKYQILAGNVEQALKTIYSNDSDFVNARVLAFREGISNTNPNTVEKVICEFSLTFGQEAVSPDAKLLEFVRSHQNRLDDMPIYSTTLKLSEYHFDPKDPHQQFLSPSNMSLIDVRSNVPKSLIPQRTQDTQSSNTTTLQPVNESRGETPYILHGTYAFNAVPIPPQQQQNQNTQRQSQSMMALQSYLKAQNNQTTPREQSTGRVLGATGMVGNSPPLWNAQTQQSQAPINNTANMNPSSQNQARKKVPYILRLFFWKDMLARKKRASQPLPSHRRLQRKKRQEPVDTESKVDNNKRVKRRPIIDIHRKNRNQSEAFALPNTLPEGTREERRHKKTRRKTKDLSVEKELRRSKRS